MRGKMRRKTKRRAKKRRRRGDKETGPYRGRTQTRWGIWLLLLVFGFLGGYLLEPLLIVVPEHGVDGGAADAERDERLVITTGEGESTDDLGEEETDGEGSDEEDTEGEDESAEEDDGDGGEEVVDKEEDDGPLDESEGEGDDEPGKLEDEGEEGETPIDTEKIRRRFIEDDGSRPVSEEKCVSKLGTTQWKNPKAVYRRLAQEVTMAWRRVGVNNVYELVQNPEVRLKLAQWELLHHADLDALTNVMHVRGNAEILTPLLNDTSWVSALVYDGELVRAEVVLSMVAEMRRADPQMDVAPEGKERSDVKRRVAAAVAAEFTRNHWYGGDPGLLSKRELKRMKMMGQYYENARRTRLKGGAKKEADPYRQARERYTSKSRQLVCKLPITTHCDRKIANRPMLSS